ncbi:hypothetical protein IKG06_01960 [Candidatus Saccharibacteria bacterium]|nr:hypothetical protein [Candidatus Saccharibacteria bacterium]
MSKASKKEKLKLEFPQLFYLAFALFYWGYSLAKDGIENTYTVAPAILVAVFLILLFSIGLYAWGGFFRKINWPQIIRIAFWVFALYQVVSKYGQPIKTETSFYGTFLSLVIETFLLYKGGFFTH